MSDLQAKLDRYESRAAHCSKAAQDAKDEPARRFYEELARYYADLASDFRRVIAKRSDVSLAAE